MVNITPPEYPLPPIATVTAEILQQVLAQNKDMMKLLYYNSGKSVIKNINRPPTTSTGPHQGQLHQPIPEYFDKYFWTHGHGIYKGGNCKSKMDGSNYGCTE